MSAAAVALPFVLAPFLLVTAVAIVYAQLPEPYRDRGCERARHRLADLEALLELGFSEPSALLNEVALRVSDQRDRAAEAGGPEREEGPRQPAERAAARLHATRGRCARRGTS